MQNRKGIWILNQTGDQLLCENGKVAGAATVATVDNEGDVNVSWDALNAFMDDCIDRYGQIPMVSGRKAGATEFDMLHRSKPVKPDEKDAFEMQPEQLIGIEEVLVAYPLRGG